MENCAVACGCTLPTMLLDQAKVRSEPLGKGRAGHEKRDPILCDLQWFFETWCFRQAAIARNGGAYASRIDFNFWDSSLFCTRIV